jgi:hypothetical protein
MNFETLQIKLKKRRLFKSLEFLTKAYCFLVTPTANKLMALAPHSSPSTLNNWLKRHQANIPELKIQTYRSIINSYNGNIMPLPAKRLKIAICLSGDIRTAKQCLNSFHRFFNGHDIDIFVSNKSSENTQFIQDNYKPKQIINYKDIDYSNLEKAGIKKFGFLKLKDNSHIPEANPNLYPMWYGIKQSFEALIKSNHNLNDYDSICRCRFDTYFKKPLDLNDFEKNTIYLDPNYNEHGGYSDQFAIGSPSAMSQYFTLYDWLQESFDFDFSVKGFLPERVLRVYLEEQCKLNITPHDFDTRLLRDEFIGLDGYQIPIKGIKTNQNRNRKIAQYVREKFPDLYPQ